MYVHKVYDGTIAISPVKPFLVSDEDKVFYTPQNIPPDWQSYEFLEEIPAIRFVLKDDGVVEYLLTELAHCQIELSTSYLKKSDTLQVTINPISDIVIVGPTRKLLRVNKTQFNLTLSEKGRYSFEVVDSFLVHKPACVEVVDDIVTI